MSKPSFSTRVHDLLQDSATLYGERNEVYKDNVDSVGRVMMALFPKGAPALKTKHDYKRWHIFELIIVKLTRYANNYEKGGHQDSISDLRPYAAILEALDENTEPDLDQLRNGAQEDGLSANGISAALPMPTAAQLSLLGYRPSPAITKVAIGDRDVLELGMWVCFDQGNPDMYPKRVVGFATDNHALLETHMGQGAVHYNWCDAAYVRPAGR